MIRIPYHVIRMAYHRFEYALMWFGCRMTWFGYPMMLFGYPLRWFGYPITWFGYHIMRTGYGSVSIQMSRKPEKRVIFYAFWSFGGQFLSTSVLKDAKKKSFQCYLSKEHLFGGIGYGGRGQTSVSTLNPPKMATNRAHDQTLEKKCKKREKTVFFSHFSLIVVIQRLKSRLESWFFAKKKFE